MDYIDNPIIESVEGSVEEIVDKKIEEGLKDLDINGILTPYIAEFTVADLKEALSENKDIIITKELVDAVKAGRTLIIRYDLSTPDGGIIASSYYIEDKAFPAISIEFTIIDLLPVAYSLYIETPVDVTEYVLHSSSIWRVISQPQLHSGEDIKTINGQPVLGNGDIVINEPYLAPFSVSWLDDAIDGYYFRFPKDEFIDAVTSGRPLVVPIYDRYNSSITASYYTTPATAETGKGIVVDIIHGSKVYRLFLEDDFENDFFIVSPDNVSCKDISNVYVTDFTLKELLSGRPVTITEQFVNAIQAKAQILIPVSSSGAYVVVTHLDSSISRDNFRITMEFIKDRQLHDVGFTYTGTVPFQVVPSVTITDLITSNSPDVNNRYVLPYTFNEIQSAARNGSTLHIDSDFVDAVNSKKLILIPAGKITEVRYIVAHYAQGHPLDSNLNIRLKIMDPSLTGNDACYLIQFSAKSSAPAEAIVSLTENYRVNAAKDSLTINRPSGEWTVGSIDGASFTNDGKNTAMTPNTVYNFVNNGVKRTIAVYDDHRLVITSENNSTVALSPAVKYFSSYRIPPSMLPSYLITKPDWLASA